MNVAERLERLRGGEPPRSVTAAVVAAQSENTRCNLLTVANAAAMSLDRLLAETPWALPFGPANAAITRGKAFEKMVKANRYERLLKLLREEFGWEDTRVRIDDLRSRFPLDRRDPYRSLRARADATRALILAHLERDPSAPNLIDGAVLTVAVGRQTGYVEADSIALRFDGPIRVGEIKSFPIVDGAADPEKVGAAADQSAVYVLAMQDLVASLGGDPETNVSTEILLIAARNMGMNPVLHRIDVARRVAHHRRELAGAADIETLVAAIPEQLTFPRHDDPHRVDVLAAVANRTGTHYEPRCLSFCGAARWCRERAEHAAELERLGGGIVRLLPGVASMRRAGQLAAGASATDREAPAAAQLARAARLIRAASPVGSSGRRRGRVA